jgi:uncharacterized protein YndB with AHSA1/START domain
MNANERKESAKGERDVMTISREYEFPRETVFRMFTDPDKAVKLYSPDGAEKLDFELDPRPGGVFRVHDRFEGRTGRTSGSVVEFVVPELLVLKTATTIQPENSSFQALQTVKFEALGSRKTRITVQVRVLEVSSFPDGVPSLLEGFSGGWGQTLDIVQRELRV